MRLIVTGLPRSGTSVMMRALQAGGLQLFFDRDLERRFASAFPKANPDGFFELRQESMIRAGLPDNHVAKIFPSFIRWLPQNVPYLAVVMHRDTSAREASYRRVFQQGNPAAVAGRFRMFEANLREGLSYMRSRSEFSILDVRLEDLVADPVRGIETVAAFIAGTELNISNAVAVFADRATGVASTC